MTSSENFGNKMNYLFKRMNSFLSLKKYGLGIIVTISLIMIFLFDLAKIYLG